MTPERKKWWDGLSDKEKYLRTEIEGYEDAVKACKHLLNNPTSRLQQDYKGYIRKNKYMLAALKHELERFNKTTKVNAYETPWNTIYGCDYCATIIGIGGKPNFKFCPCCGRRIKNR